MTRDRFVKVMLAGAGAAVTGVLSFPALRFLWPAGSATATQNEVVAGKSSDLKPNSGKIFQFRGKPAILIRDAGGDFRAFSGVCKHLGCTVQYKSEGSFIWCACHNGHFDAKTGAVLSGPPPTGLDLYKVALRGDDVVVSA